MPPFARLLIEEGAAEAVAGIGDEHVDRLPAGGVEQLVDSGRGGEVGLDRANLDAEALERGRGVDQRRVRGHDQVVAVPGGEPGDLKADSARGAGDDGELRLDHGLSPFRA